uniref:Uncharacterized protein n=1 Tax=Knipowitschia caucasica TaxID=637954 RepID=A0AAV2LCE4_KNICA
MTEKNPEHMEDSTTRINSVNLDELVNRLVNGVLQTSAANIQELLLCIERWKEEAQTDDRLAAVRDKAERHLHKFSSIRKTFVPTEETMCVSSHGPAGLTEAGGFSRFVDVDFVSLSRVLTAAKKRIVGKSPMEERVLGSESRDQEEVSLRNQEQPNAETTETENYTTRQRIEGDEKVMFLFRSDGKSLMKSPGLSCPEEETDHQTSRHHVAGLESTPESVIPESVIPESVIPESAIPESVIPESVIPESIQRTPRHPVAGLEATPESVIPESVIPESVIPESVIPESVIPESVIPESLIPESLIPESVIPESVIPESVIPESVIPESAIPESAIPESTISESVIPESVIPESVIPESAIPESAIPESTISESVIPESVESVIQVSLIPESLIPESVIQVSLIPESLIPESVIPESVIPESVIPESVIPESVIPESVIPESVIPESVIPESVESVIRVSAIPESVIPESVIPESLIPESVIPESVIPESTIPESTIPESVIPESVIPESVIPDSVDLSQSQSEFSKDKEKDVEAEEEAEEEDPDQIFVFIKDKQEAGAEADEAVAADALRQQFSLMCTVMVTRLTDTIVKEVFVSSGEWLDSPDKARLKEVFTIDAFHQFLKKRRESPGDRAARVRIPEEAAAEVMDRVRAVVDKSQQTLFQFCADLAQLQTSDSDGRYGKTSSGHEFWDTEIDKMMPVFCHVGKSPKKSLEVPSDSTDGKLCSSFSCTETRTSPRAFPDRKVTPDSPDKFQAGAEADEAVAADALRQQFSHMCTVMVTRLTDTIVKEVFVSSGEWLDSPDKARLKEVFTIDAFHQFLKKRRESPGDRAARVRIPEEAAAEVMDRVRAVVDKSQQTLFQFCADLAQLRTPDSDGRYGRSRFGAKCEKCHKYIRPKQTESENTQNTK